MNEDQLGAEALWPKVNAQVVALASFVGLFAGALRARGTMSAKELEQVFELADRLLPSAAGVEATQLLATIRDASRQITADPND